MADLESIDSLLQRTYIQACDTILRESSVNGVLIKALHFAQKSRVPPFFSSENFSDSKNPSIDIGEQKYNEHKTLMDNNTFLEPKNQANTPPNFKNHPTKPVLEQKNHSRPQKNIEKNGLFFSGIHRNGSFVNKPLDKENLSMFLAQNVEDFELEKPSFRKNTEERPHF